MNIDTASRETLQEEIAKRLMSASEHEKASYYIPYRYEVATRRGMLHFFGSRHFLDSDNHQFEKLCETIRTLRPSMVVVEHHQELIKGAPKEIRAHFLNQIQEFSLEEAVSLSESGLTVKLALEIGAAVECPEPTDTERFLYLESKGFTHEQIASYYITRAASMFPLWQHRMNLPELLEFRRAELLPSWPWEPDLLSAGSVDAYLKRSLNLEIFAASSATLAGVVLPLKPEHHLDYTVLNSVATCCTNFTDVIIVSRLLELANEYDTIFVVFGSSHAVRQEKALRELLRSGTVG
jgi:hypothetical protein